MDIIHGPGASDLERLAAARVDFVDRFFPTDNNNLAPRLGFAWDPKGDGRTSVRGGVGTTAYQDAADIQADRAIAGYDATHKISIVGLWELPFFRSSTGRTQTLLGGWQLAGSAILQSGSPINVTTGGTYPRGDLNADNNGGDRPNAPAAGVKTSGWSQDEYLNGIFKVSDFPLPVAGENGNLPRNAYRGPGYVDVSLSVTKKFRVQRWSGEFRLDAFNAFNRVNLADPTMDMSSTNFGRVTSQLTPRAFQLGVRLRF